MDINSNQSVGATTEQILHGDIPQGRDALHFGSMGVPTSIPMNDNQSNLDRGIEDRAREREDRFREREARRTHRDDRDDGRDDEDRVYFVDRGGSNRGRSRYNRDRYTRLDDRHVSRSRRESEPMVPGTNLHRADHRFLNDTIVSLDRDTVELEQEINSTQREILRRQQYLESLKIEKHEVLEMRKSTVARLTTLIDEKTE